MRHCLSKGIVFIGCLVISISCSPQRGREPEGAGSGSGQTAPANLPPGNPERKEQPAPRVRPEQWAQPLEREGLPNLHRVSDRLYRGAQPAREGFKQLKEMGVKTVVNLRSFHSDGAMLADQGLDYEHIYMKAWHPEEKEVVRFFKIVNDDERTPVFVHCLHGADRTGTMCALYRVAFEDWSKEEALQEMTEGDFNFHSVFANLPEFIEEIDLDEIKAQAGMAGADARQPALVDNG